MIKRTLLFGNPIWLSTGLDQLIGKFPESGKEEIRIPIEDIGLIVLDHSQISISHALLARLLENNAAVVTCDARHMPTGLLLNLDGNTLQRQRFEAQLSASEPLKKQIWQQTVRAKINNQASIIESISSEAVGLRRWANEVKSGDPENMEARAAAWYWPRVFKTIPGFIRNRSGLFPNSMLNYGYAILRAITARSLVGSGLLPVAGIFHRNQYNAYCLADDIMEPYRPYVDQLVSQLLNEGQEEEPELTPETKRKLLVLPATDVVIEGETSPLMIAMQRTTASLAKCFLGETRKVLYPVLG